MVGADTGKGLGVAGVATEIRAMFGPDERPRCPERVVAAEEAPGEVPRRQADQGELVDLCALIPVELDNALVRYPQYRRCAPTPSGTKNGARCMRANARTVSASRWS